MFLMGHASWDLEDSSAKNNLDYDGMVQLEKFQRMLITGLEITLVLLCQRM